MHFYHTYYNSIMYKTLKIPFKHIIKDDQIVPVFEDMIIRTNKIIKHTYYYIKLYTLYCFDNNIIMEKFTKENIRYIYSLVSTIKTKLEIKNVDVNMKKFYDNVFSKININKVSRDGLTVVLAYEADIIVTCIENNIKNNFVRHFNRYINAICNIKNKIASINDINQKKLLWKQLRLFKTDILSFDEYKSEDELHNTIKKQQMYLFNRFYDNNDEKANVNTKKCIQYYVAKNPQDYIYTFYKIISKFESLNKNIPDDEKQHKLFNILPLRTSLIPKHITIDSEILIQNFKEKIKENLNKFPTEIINVEDLRRNFTTCQDILWNLFFKIDKNINKKFKFDYLLKTDNLSCSLQFAIKTEEKKQRFKKGVAKGTVKDDIKKIKEHQKIEYIDDILANNRFALKNKKIACIDPNKGDLIYSGTYKNNKLVTFRYTNNQRRKEKKTKKYSKIRQILAKNATVIVDNKITNITKIESIKSNYKKTESKKEKMIEYIKDMEQIDKIIEDHYKLPIFRKLNINGYINTQRSESRMINNFKKIIGEPEDTVVIIGDNGLKDVVIKGLEATISKGIIEIFKKNHYKIYVIDEFRTSKLCNGCENELSKFLNVKSKKPKSKGKEYKSHGILRCQSSATCNVIHNRDKNAVKNMLKIISHYQLTGERLEKYSR